MKQFLTCLCGALLLAGCGSNKYVAPQEGRITISSYEPTTLVVAKGKPNYRKSQKNSEWFSSNSDHLNNRPNVVLPEKVSLAHTISVGEGVDEKEGVLLPTPVVKNGVIYTLDNEFVLQATDLKTAVKKWAQKLDEVSGTSFKSIGLAVNGDRVYAISGNGLVVAVTPSGKVVWKENLKTQLRSEPVVDRGYLYLSDINNQLIVLDSETGKMIWAYQGEKALTNLFGIGSVAVSKNMVIAPTTSGRVNAFDRTTGVLLWTEDMWQKKTYNPMLDIPQMTASPVIDGSVAYLVGNAGKMGAYQVEDGRALFVLSTGGRKTPVVNGNTLLMVNHQNELLALNKENGQQYWKVALRVPDDDKEVGTLTAMIHSKNYLDREKKVALNRSWFSPILAGNQIVLVASDGNVLFLDSQTGKTQNHFKTDKIVASPIVVNQSLILLTQDGELQVYQ